MPPSVRRAIALISLMASPAVVAAQATERPLRSAPVSALRFEVQLAAEEAFLQSLRVTASFRVEGRDPVLLSMPAWTPGSYEIANFARQVSAFTARQGGRELRWDKLDPDTWRIIPSGRGEITLT